MTLIHVTPTSYAHIWCYVPFYYHARRLFLLLFYYYCMLYCCCCAFKPWRHSEERTQPCGATRKTSARHSIPLLTAHCSIEKAILSTRWISKDIRLVYIPVRLHVQSRNSSSGSSGGSFENARQQRYRHSNILVLVVRSRAGATSESDAALHCFCSTRGTSNAFLGLTSWFRSSSSLG